MDCKSISYYLRPYKMLAHRRTTINHAFAAAVAPHDSFDESAVRTAMSELGQDPDKPLRCAYCGVPAETWDHIRGTVRASHFSGAGHRLGNLLPCCKPCNSRKGNRDWQAFINALGLAPELVQARTAAIGAHLERYAVDDSAISATPEHEELQRIRKQVLKLLAQGDELAATIRQQYDPVPSGFDERDEPVLPSDAELA